MVVGEASGDLLGAKLMQALQARCPGLQFEGMGGPAMQALGFKSHFDAERLAVMGLIEPLLHLPDLIRLRRDLYHFFIEHRPDVFIGIDSPDFNLGLEVKLKQAGLPVVHVVSPSVWAWRQGRVKTIKKAVNLMLTLLPFEAAFYEAHEVPVRYVGHPLAETIPMVVDTAAAKLALGLASTDTVIALLPGSRQQEIKYLAEPYLLAAKQCFEANPQLKFITAQVNEKRAEAFLKVKARVAPELPLQCFIARSHEVMAAADAVVVTSGTATLEVMLHKKPMVIAYRMSPITHWLAKKLVKLKHMGLPNLLADERLVPELLQDEVTPEAIAKQVLHFLDDQAASDVLRKKFTDLHQQLKMPTADAMADAVMVFLKRAPLPNPPQA
jgi:lipid-A-disaccharide synthase